MVTGWLEKTWTKWLILVYKIIVEYLDDISCKNEPSEIDTINQNGATRARTCLVNILWYWVMTVMQIYIPFTLF